MSTCSFRPPRGQVYIRPDLTLQERVRLDQMRQAARGCWRALQPIQLNPARTGFWLCHATTRTSNTVFNLLVPVGTIPENRVSTFSAIAIEKTLRLADHPDHFTSFESRSEGRGRYGGAIRWGDDILAASGLEEHDDTAICVGMNWLLSPMPTQARLRIIGLEQNHQVARLLERLA